MSKQKQSKPLPPADVQRDGMRKLRYRLMDKEYSYDELGDELEINPLYILSGVGVVAPLGVIVGGVYHSVEKCANCEGPHVINLQTDDDTMTFREAILNPSCEMNYDLKKHNLAAIEGDRPDLIKTEKKESAEGISTEVTDHEDVLEDLRSRTDSFSKILLSILEADLEQARKNQN
jgi:hypothetical protein